MPNVTVTIESTLLAKARQKAKQECRSLSKQISFLILQDVAASKAAREAKAKGEVGNL